MVTPDGSRLQGRRDLEEDLDMIPKSGHRFSEKIMLRQLQSVMISEANIITL